jgi:hypothetical protein
LNLHATSIGAAGLAALERGEWPALESISVRGGGCPRLTLKAARRWAPALQDAAETKFPVCGARIGCGMSEGEEESE